MVSPKPDHVFKLDLDHGARLTHGGIHLEPDKPHIQFHGSQHEDTFKIEVTQVVSRRLVTCRWCGDPINFYRKGSNIFFYGHNHGGGLFIKVWPFSRNRYLLRQSFEASAFLC